MALIASQLAPIPAGFHLGLHGFIQDFVARIGGPNLGLKDLKYTDEK